MIKLKLLIVLMLFMINCDNGQLKSKATSFEHHKKELEGKWGMVEYFDSIQIEKRIADYRVQYPTWFGIVLEFDQDSMFTYGSIYDMKLKYQATDDTIAKINVNDEGEWILKKEGRTLTLSKAKEVDDEDVKIYHYRKREDIEFDRTKLKSYHKLNAFTKALFNEIIFSGKYQLLADSNLVEFKGDGTLIGLEDFSNFQVNNYFGTLHPFSNKDMVSLYNESKRESYHWEFRKEKLILTQFKRDSVISNGLTYPSEDFILGEKKIELYLVN